jgi:hypothetical protein
VAVTMVVGQRVTCPLGRFWGVLDVKKRWIDLEV